MGVIARVVGVAACGLSLAVLAAAPTAGADPTGALPPMTSSGSGPVIGDGDAALRQRISQQLFSFGDPTVQEVDGSDAAQFITAAAAVADRDVASVFLPLQRVLGCQQNTAGSGAGFGARAYRRTDGQWGGAMLVVAKSTVSDVEAASLPILPVIIGLGHLLHRLSHRGVVELHLHEVRFGTGTGRVDRFGERDHVSDKRCSFFDEGWVVACKANFQV